MYDRTTESLWQQFTGEGIVGVHAGDQLDILPASIISFADFRTAHADGLVLSRETGHSRSYGYNPYEGYDTPDRQPFLFAGAPDDRLPAMLRVVGVEVGDTNIAYPYSVLADAGVVNDTVNGQELAVFFAFGTASALNKASIADSDDVGAATVYVPVVDGQKLTFKIEGGWFVDEETGSIWNILGQAVGGPLEGRSLTPFVHSDHFWFSWAAFFPDTLIYGVE